MIVLSKRGRKSIDVPALVQKEIELINSSLNEQRDLGNKILNYLKILNQNIKELSGLEHSGQVYSYINTFSEVVEKINWNMLGLETLYRKLKKIEGNIENSLDAADEIKYYNRMYTVFFDRISSTSLEIKEFIDLNIVEDAAPNVQESMQAAHTVASPNTEAAKKIDEFMIYNYGSTVIPDVKPAEQEPADAAENPQFVEDTLIISGNKGKVILPYKLEEVNKIMERHPKKYKSPQDVIDALYTKPNKYYKNTAKARFREAFKLVSEREKGSLRKALDLGVELFFNYNVHPAVISACKNINELDVYLSCLEYNELDDFHFFKIIFNSVPAIVKLNKMGRRSKHYV